MFWIAIVIYCILVIISFILEKWLKKEFNLAKKLTYTKRFNSQQTLVEILILIIFIIGAFLASITVYDSGSYRPLNPIPYYLWLALFMLVFLGYRGYMVKKFAKESKEYIIYFSFSLWNPIMIIIAYHTTKSFLN